MPGGVATEAARQDPRLRGFGETQLQRQGLTLDTGAPVTGAISTGTAVAAGFGDGVVRFFRPDKPPTIVEAHGGAVLCLATEAASGAVLTGGDDGRFLRIFLDGTIEEIASFGTRWVDCVATASGSIACTSGRTAYVWCAGDSTPRTFEHPCTVGGLAFDAKARRLAVAH
ncbi:WD40 repeat domain-containing protein [Acuticoccus mangrovi]|uniref:Anaphase-promoting complex subunit 4 WD40 domain-containing protein n=1 Tax=Acuticoccus mangrovi TaxID=2796142 RepID=A0A934ISM4_9HYPH|nr:hypothetical protein [Acuticoccus mangrovi]MBJ3777980.1 hypothetical protein [Acuticoccus mangrovi]